MVLCKFFQSGTCRKGNSCNFEHIRTNQWGNNSNAATGSKYNEGSFKTNLTDERPQWKLSVFGPAKEEPNLIVGTDKSPEEDRYLYYTSMRTTGNNSQYIASHEQSFNQMETQVNAIINNPSGAFQHYEKEKSKNASPFQGAVSTAPFAPFTGGGAFGSSTTSAFGKPSAFGSTTTTTTSAFGKPSAFGSTGASAFGQPSTLGSGSAFGQTSALGGGSAFGQTSSLGSGSAFGQTSALGGGGSAFGQTSALGGGSAFGQTSSMGSGSAFGQTSSLGGNSAFGQTSSLGNNSAFGQPAPAFGSTSSLGNNSAFGQPAPAPAFGSTSSLGAFGQPSALGSNNTSTTAFGSAPSSSSTITVVPMATGGNKQSEIEAFQAPVFTYQAIPEVEPPIELR